MFELCYLFCFQDEVWPYRMKNKSSLGELWLQLLEFYATENFHKSQKVVCIRKKDPLYKFDKLWTSTNICIEDPFDLNHNLGSGLSKRSMFNLTLTMHNYFINLFLNSLTPILAFKINRKIGIFSYVFGMKEINFLCNSRTFELLSSFIAFLNTNILLPF